MHTRRFRPSAYYGAAEDPFDWLEKAKKRAVITPAGNVYGIAGEGGAYPAGTIVWLYDTKGQPQKVPFPPDHPEYTQTLQVLVEKGRIVSVREGTEFANSRRPTADAPAAAPAAAFTTSAPAPAAPAAPGAPAPKKKKRRKVRAPGGPLAIIKKTWFPFAVGGVALLAIGVIALVIKSRRTAQGAA